MDLERRFSIARETPQGSMSKVYRATDKNTGRTICRRVQPGHRTRTRSTADLVRRPSESDR